MNQPARPTLRDIVRAYHDETDQFVNWSEVALIRGICQLDDANAQIANLRTMGLDMNEALELSSNIRAQIEHCLMVPGWSQGNALNN